MTSADILSALDGLLKRFNWTTVGLLCDSMSHLPGVANFHFYTCGSVASYLTTKEYTWTKISFDSAKETNYFAYLQALKRQSRSRFFISGSINHVNQCNLYLYIFVLQYLFCFYYPMIYEN